MTARNYSRFSSRHALATVLLAVVLAVSSAIPALAISRTTIVARGRSWVDRAVPYSQSLFFEGYRQDCSGFLSMSWVLSRNGAPISYSTADLDAPGLVERIYDKADIQPGDMILRPKDQIGAAYGHSVLFVAWADPGRTKYIGYHESSGSGKAVMATIPYPFWNETGFAPYRYKNVDADYLDTIAPVFGQSRYETAVQSSWIAFPTVGSAKAVVLATGENWPDALGGAALAGATDAPVLLTKPDTLPESVRAEIDRLNVAKVYVLGGAASVSTTVAAAVDAISGVTVQRIGGTDRWDTAARIAAETKARMLASGRSVDGVYVATGRDFPDALAASPASFVTGRPILLTEPSDLPTVTANAIKTLGVDDAWVIGGLKAVGTTATAEIESLGLDTTRIEGATRYETSLRLAAHAESLGMSWKNLGVATGLGYADALAGGVAQGATRSILVLTPGGWLDPGVASAITSHRAAIGRVRCFGGTAAIGDATRAQIDSAMGGS